MNGPNYALDYCWPGANPERGDGIRVEGTFGKELRIVFCGQHRVGYPLWMPSVGSLKEEQRTQEAAKAKEIEWFMAEVRRALEEDWPRAPEPPPEPEPSALQVLRQKVRGAIDGAIAGFRGDEDDED